MEAYKRRHSECDKSGSFPEVANLDERQRRLFCAHKAMELGTHGVSLVCKTYHVTRNTVYRGIHELESGDTIAAGHIRKKGGGRKSILSVHPEYIDIFREITEDAIGGLPQDESVRMLFYSPGIIRDKMEVDYGISISYHTLKQIISKEGFKKRTPKKCTSMAECNKRNEQFEKISAMRSMCEENHIPVFSIDTKKKELVGPFRRGGQVYCDRSPRCRDHDFPSFASGKIIPYGIYDVQKNTGYMSFGISHDTAGFSCDNFKYYWYRVLQDIYPHATAIMLLCDGGGSNSSSSRLFKQELIKLSEDLHIDIIVAHYPPYTSKWNPIEHRLFSQITRVWSGISFESVEQACELAAEARTKSGLCVFTNINRKKYDTSRGVDSNYDDVCQRHITFDEELPKWNYKVSWRDKKYQVNF